MFVCLQSLNGIQILSSKKLYLESMSACWIYLKAGSKNVFYMTKLFNIWKYVIVMDSVNKNSSYLCD